MKKPITINIKSLIGTLVIVNTNKEETAEQIAETVKNALHKVIESGQGIQE